MTPYILGLKGLCGGLLYGHAGQKGSTAMRCSYRHHTWHMVCLMLSWDGACTPGFRRYSCWYFTPRDPINIGNRHSPNSWDALYSDIRQELMQQGFSESAISHTSSSGIEDQSRELSSYVKAQNGSHKKKIIFIAPAQAESPPDERLFAICCAAGRHYRYGRFAPRA